MKARLYDRYVKEVVPALKEKRKYTNVHQVPRMEKIVVNMGVSASLEKSAVDDAAKDLALITTALPRIRDFRGLSTRSFDGRGNYSLGVGDQTIFPEIELDKIKRQQGMDITIVTSARTNEEALDFLKLMGMPFAEAKQSEPKKAKTVESAPKEVSEPKEVKAE